MRAFWRRLAPAVCLLVLMAGERDALATALNIKASGPKTFYVDQRVGTNQVVIFSQSTIEDFASVINRVAGQFQIDPRHLEHLSGEFSVRATDIRTGTDLRDHQLYGPDWLDAARYPLMDIKIARAESVQKKATSTATMILVGTCSIHGVTHDVRILATLIYLDESPITMQRAKGDLISVRANFEFKLSDYKITGPGDSAMIGLKVADVQPIRVSIFASSEEPPAPLDLGGLSPGGQAAGSQPTGGAAAAPTSMPNYPILAPPQRPSR